MTQKKKFRIDSNHVPALLFSWIADQVTAQGTVSIPQIKDKAVEFGLTKNKASRTIKELRAPLENFGIVTEGEQIKQALPPKLTGPVKDRLTDNVEAKLSIAIRLADHLEEIRSAQNRLRVFFGPGTLVRECAKRTDAKSRGIEFLTNNLLVVLDYMTEDISPHVCFTAPGSLVKATRAIKHQDVQVLRSWFVSLHPQASVMSFHTITVNDDGILFSADPENSDPKMILAAIESAEDIVYFVAASNKLSKNQQGKPVIQLRNRQWYNVAGEKHEAMSIKAKVHFITESSNDSFITSVREKFEETDNVDMEVVVAAR